jgi:hypothetical protein
MRREGGKGEIRKISQGAKGHTVKNSLGSTELKSENCGFYSFVLHI